MSLSQHHETVLLHEAVDALAIKPADIIVDATFGAGGHAREILSQLGEGGRYIGLDLDPTALTHELTADTRVTLLQGNFRHIGTLVSESVNGIVADLGWRMEQFSGNGKGFSFRVDEPLLMTLGEPDDYLFTARDIVNDWDEANIADVIYGYGEDRYARRIAKAIVAARAEAAIETSVQLADIVTSAVPLRARYGRTHPATKTFQALRITVNDELGALATFIEESLLLLQPGGRLAIITFHSLEDRIVKQRFKTAAATGQAVLVTKKPLTPSDEELVKNPRARSAKLRILELT